MSEVKFGFSYRCWCSGGSGRGPERRGGVAWRGVLVLELGGATPVAYYLATWYDGLTTGVCTDIPPRVARRHSIFLPPVLFTYLMN